MKKVVKFGGSSLASAQQFKKVGDIIRSDEARKYVVPSAPGKRFDGDTKVTDMSNRFLRTNPLRYFFNSGPEISISFSFGSTPFSLQ